MKRTPTRPARTAASLSGRRVILGVTGGIAAYKAADLASKLRHAGAEVTVIMTQAAQEFVRPLTFESITHREVHTDLFAPHSLKPNHISLAEWAELLVVAPATANTIAKLSLGLADNLLTCVALATKAKLLIAPAMNDGMYSHPATKQHLKTLRLRGAVLVGPEPGQLACGREGWGRMSEPAEILAAIQVALNGKALKS